MLIAAVKNTLLTLSLAMVAALASACGGANVASELEHLRTVVPSQSHTMTDVGYHWTNLWFAGKSQNWPLAEFYFNEARQHIQWTIAVRPVRKDADGHDVDLKPIFDAVDATLLAAVRVSLLKKDAAGFEASYRAALDGCYSCHKASSKPFLRLVVPTAPAQTLIDFTPEAGPGR